MNRERTRHVVVVGSGIAGLCVAYYLRERNLDVTILDSGRVGNGASLGNGGWICPAQAGPLPEPGRARTAIRNQLKRDSALYIHPDRWREFGPWLLRFWSYCNERDYKSGLAALASFSRDVFALIEQMSVAGVEFELHRAGMLVVAREEAVVRSELAKLALMRKFGYDLPHDVVSGAELHELEPALSPDVSFGFKVREHWHVRPETLTRGLAAALVDMGVNIVERSEVIDFEVSGSTVVAAVIPDGIKTADAFVLAAGAWTGRLARRLNVHIPLQGGKGYSFFVTPKVVPRHSVLLADVHVGCTPFGDQMRIGGTMEFSGLNTNIDHRRVTAIISGAEASFLQWLDQPTDGFWAGLRPITPDGLPLIDRLCPYENVYVATGYAMLGMTLAAPGGLALAKYIASGEKPLTLAPFAADRFRSFWR